MSYIISIRLVTFTVNIQKMSQTIVYDTKI